MVEPQPSKLKTWVRFPSPALSFGPTRRRLVSVVGGGKTVLTTNVMLKVGVGLLDRETGEPSHVSVTMRVCQWLYDR